jgi:hypothetical protein
MMISTSLRSQVETVDKQHLLSKSRQFSGALVGTTGAKTRTLRDPRSPVSAQNLRLLISEQVVTIRIARTASAN